MLRDFKQLPVELPRLNILKRMGYNRHLSIVPPAHAARLDRLIDDAFVLCQPMGRLLILPVTGRSEEELILGETMVLRSASLAKLLLESNEAVLMAVTVGAEVVRETTALVNAGAGADALVYDAVASEVTDAGLDWLQTMLARELPRRGLRQTKHRFSPGYGDLGLEAQAEIFRLLRLDELGLNLNEHYIMHPEKSVTAIVGLEPGT